MNCVIDFAAEVDEVLWQYIQQIILMRGLLNNHLRIMAKLNTKILGQFLK